MLRSLKDNLCSKNLKVFIAAILSSVVTLCAISCNEDRRHQYKVDEQLSVVNWKGYLREGGNNGTIQVKGDLTATDEGKVVKGNFAMPLSTLADLNLPNEELKEQLVHHLQGPDLFNMGMYPEIRFTVKEMLKDNDGHILNGDLEFLGKSNDISFPVIVSIEGDMLHLQGKVRIDRTRWGLNYATDINAPDGQYIRPDIDLELELTAHRQ